MNNYFSAHRGHISNESASAFRKYIFFRFNRIQTTLIHTIILSCFTKNINHFANEDYIYYYHCMNENMKILIRRKRLMLKRPFKLAHGTYEYRENIFILFIINLLSESERLLLYRITDILPCSLRRIYPEFPKRC